MQRPGLGQAGKAVGRAHAHGGGLFYYALAVRHRVQRGFKRPALDREGRVPGQPVFEGYGLHALEELFKAAGGEEPQFEQYALSKAGADVCPRQACRVSFKEHAPILGRDIFHSHVSQLVAERAFQPKETGRAEPHPRAGIRLDHTQSPSEEFYCLFAPIKIQ